MSEQAKDTAAHATPKVQKKLKPLSEISAAAATKDDVDRAAKQSPPDCDFLSKVADINALHPAKDIVAKYANDRKNTPGVCAVAVWSDKPSDPGGSNTGSDHGSTSDDKKGANSAKPMSAADALEAARKAADPKKK